MKTEDSPDGSKKIKNFSSINLIIILLNIVCFQINAYLAANGYSEICKYIVYFFNIFLLFLGIVMFWLQKSAISSILNSEEPIAVIINPVPGFHMGYAFPQWTLMMCCFYFYDNNWYFSLACHLIGIWFFGKLKILGLLKYSNRI